MREVYVERDNMTDGTYTYIHTNTNFIGGLADIVRLPNKGLVHLLLLLPHHVLEPALPGLVVLLHAVEHLYEEVGHQRHRAEGFLCQVNNV